MLATTRRIRPPLREPLDMTRKTAPPGRRSATPINVRSRRPLSIVRTVVSGLVAKSRKQLRLSQERLADELGISERQLRRVENGEQPIDLEVLMQPTRYWRKFLRCLVETERKSGAL